jgi:hypothetical protein
VTRAKPQKPIPEPREGLALQRAAAVRLAEAVKGLLERAGRSQLDYGWTVHRELMLLNADGSEGATLNGLLRQAIKVDDRHAVPLSGLFLPSEIGLLPLIDVVCDCRSSVLEMDTVVHVSNDAVTAIFEDLLTNTLEYVNEDGTREPGSRGE